MRTAKILRDAAELHKYLRTYGALNDQDKPKVIAGVLFALDENKSGSFTLDVLTGDTITTDGDKIFEAIKKRLQRSSICPDVNRDILMNEFSVIRTNSKLNTVDAVLCKTPLKYYAEFLKSRVLKILSEDFMMSLCVTQVLTNKRLVSY